MGLPMGKKITTYEPPIDVRYKGVFDFEGLYRFMYNWLIQRKWRFQEDVYKDKKRSPLGNEIECKWSADRRTTEFVKFFININIHLWTAKEVMIEQDGVKRKMMKARMNINFKSWIVLDYHGMFDQGTVSRWWGKVIGWLRQREFEKKYIDALQYETYRFAGAVRKYLNVEAKEDTWS